MENPIKMDDLGVPLGYHHLRKHPYDGIGYCKCYFCSRFFFIKGSKEKFEGPGGLSFFLLVGGATLVELSCRFFV